MVSLSLSLTPLTGHTHTHTHTIINGDHPNGQSACHTELCTEQCCLGPVTTQSECSSEDAARLKNWTARSLPSLLPLLPLAGPSFINHNNREKRDKGSVAAAAAAGTSDKEATTTKNQWSLKNELSWVDWLTDFQPLFPPHLDTRQNSDKIVAKRSQKLGPGALQINSSLSLSQSMCHCSY